MPIQYVYEYIRAGILHIILCMPIQYVYEYIHAGVLHIILCMHIQYVYEYIRAGVLHIILCMYKVYTICVWVYMCRCTSHHFLYTHFDARLLLKALMVKLSNTYNVLNSKLSPVADYSFLFYSNDYKWHNVVNPDTVGRRKAFNWYFLWNRSVWKCCYYRKWNGSDARQVGKTCKVSFGLPQMLHRLSLIHI